MFVKNVTFIVIKKMIIKDIYKPRNIMLTNVYIMMTQKTPFHAHAGKHSHIVKVSQDTKKHAPTNMKRNLIHNQYLLKYLILLHLLRYS